MKRITFFWRYLALFIMLFGGLSATFAQTPSNVVANELDATSVKIAWEVTGAAVLWNVNRVEVLNEAGNARTIFIDRTTDQIVTDTDWNTVAPGVYEWTVVYANSAVSNTLDVKMTTDVTVNVTTEYSDDPTALVTLTNTSEPLLLLVYTQTLDATGEYVFEDVRKGTYDVSVVLDGYVTPIGFGAEKIWADPNYTFDLLGDLAPPVNLTAVDDEIYYETNVVLNWETGASSEFHGYNVFRVSSVTRDITPLNDTPLDVTTYTDAVTLGHGYYEYFVTAVYVGGESDPSDATDIAVIEKGGYSGQITDALDAAVKIEGATITYSGTDVFGASWNGEFTSALDGTYGNTLTIWPGEYSVSVVADGFVDAAAEVIVINNDAITENVNFQLVEIAYPVTDVVATLVGDSIQIQWVANTNRAFIEYNLYRKTNLQEVLPLEDA